MSLRILSYNIHKGFSLGNKSFILKRIREALRVLSADVLFLQEVLGDHSEKIKHNPPWETQFEFLADSVWGHFAYGKNALYDGGHHGNAILSKYPLKSWSNHCISEGKREPRGLLTAAIEVNGEEIILANTHLDLLQRGRNHQVKEIIRLLHPVNKPLVLVGDFNDWNKKISPHLERSLGLTEVFKELKGKYPPTFPSFKPFLSLDRVFTRHLRVKDARTLVDESWGQLSDHLPLLADLEIPRAEL